ncbi:MAG: bifunctional aldolase/short-chain dehydrogenase [bacterium]|nr:bifunctional aldolase/short-chain dehydrogenase [bacterium]
MESRWNQTEADEFVDRFSAARKLVALRAYTSRLIGAEPDLVLHGGGNTSVKARAHDLFGDEIDVLHIKGSGWDLGEIEPAGLPAVQLAPLLELRRLEELSDEDMVAQVRANLLDPSAPNPSVETLLHAFLPHRFIDHTHADAILALTNQPDGETRVRALYGDRIAWVPYVMPGFELAILAAEIYEKQPDIEGLVLEKHGLFTFGDDARTSYERHVELVELAEAMIRTQIEGRRMLDARPVMAMRDVGEVAHVLRGALAEPSGNPDQPWKRWVVEHRSSDEILHLAASEIAPYLATAAPITPDHVIRTKSAYLFVDRPPYANLDALAERLVQEIAAYREEYREYFERNVAAKGVERRPLDSTPRVVILPGLGLFAIGETRKAARIAADIAEHTVRTRIWAASIGHYEGLSEGDLFDMEYWSLEQAKLGNRKTLPLGGQVALVTGGAGAIGEGIARKLLDAGANVVLVDLNADGLEAVAARLDSDALETVQADVTDEVDMRDAFRAATELFGGVDIAVVNAGVAQVGALDQLELRDFERAVGVNLNGAFLTLREAIAHLKRQGTGGNIVMISTKNVFAPGAEFGAYSASKAGGHQLGRVAALEGADAQIRVNMVNADAVFGEGDNPSGLWQTVGPGRAAARGLEPSELEDFYRNRNLLKARVTAEHVGQAVVFFATQQTPTTGAVLPVDGGLPDAFPR